MRCPSTGPSPWPASTRATGRPHGWSSQRPTGPSPMPASLRPSVPAGDLRYDVLGRGCSWHHDRRPIGTVPLAGKVTGACNTDHPHLRLSLHLLHEGGSAHDEHPRPTTGHGSCDRSWPSGGSLLTSAESCGPDGAESAAASDGDCDVAPPAQDWAGSSASPRPEGSSCSLSTVGADSQSGFRVCRRAANATSTRNASTSESVSGSSVRTSPA